MKNSYRKIVGIFVFVFTIFCCGVVLADGAPSYSKNMYAVVVNNQDGATLYKSSWDNKLEIYDTASYGTKFIVDRSSVINEKTYLTVSSIWDVR